MVSHLLRGLPPSPWRFTQGLRGATGGTGGRLTYSKPLGFLGQNRKSLSGGDHNRSDDRTLLVGAPRIEGAQSGLPRRGAA